MNSPPWRRAGNWSMRKSNILRTRRVTYRSNSPRNWSAMKVGTMVCTGTVLAMSSIARSTLSSLTRAKISQRTRLASTFRSMGICSGSSLAKNYIVDGKMTAGFAFVAYPVEYGSSGVMTFVVDKSGTIYEKDLGPNTTKLAQAMTAYDPDSTWHKAE